MADVTLRRGTWARDVEPALLDGVTVLWTDGVEIVLLRGTRVIRGAVERAGTSLRVHHQGLVYQLETGSGAAESKSPGPAAASELYAPMTGRVVQVLVAEGQSVKAGAPLLVVEAMKMEHKVVAPAAATVARLHVESGAQVEVGAHLVSLKPEAGP